jgi:hypothetical protein
MLHTHPCCYIDFVSARVATFINQERCLLVKGVVTSTQWFSHDGLEFVERDQRGTTLTFVSWSWSRGCQWFGCRLGCSDGWKLKPHRAYGIHRWRASCNHPHQSSADDSSVTVDAPLMHISLWGDTSGPQLPCKFLPACFLSFCVKKSHKISAEMEKF